ncbi:MAG TPA: right-handed parallel beta-helix repeat-containing protein, partial [Cryptosporangiaceae bacterium]|nr:right-handed parallel beta-helix repeat-containing protein [Cryptosporangiaceae bacterium]
MSRTLQVSPERHGAYPTIGDALAAAPRGAVVIVAPGAYIESLDLTGFVVTIAAGDGGEVIVTGGNRYAPTLASRDGNLTLRGITIRAADAPAVLVEGGELTMEHCMVSAGFGAGIRLADGAGFTITDCSVTGAQQGIVIEDASGTIDTSTVRDSVDDGIVIRLGADPTLRNCTIVGCGHRGVYVYQSGKPTLEGCDISETGDEGIAVAQNSAPVLRRCYVHDTQGVGISFAAGTSGQVDSCKLENTAQPDLDIAPGAAVKVTKAAPAAG